jgi:hypothetical protein
MLMNGFFFFEAFLDNHRDLEYIIPLMYGCFLGMRFYEISINAAFIVRNSIVRNGEFLSY